MTLAMHVIFREPVVVSVPFAAILRINNLIHLEILFQLAISKRSV